MHNLIVGYRHTVLFLKCVHKGEIQRRMVISSIERIGLNVLVEVVCPTHIPLHIKSKAALINGMSDTAKGGGFLGNHKRIGELAVDCSVKLTKECSGLKILVCTEMVGMPLTGILS